MNKNIEKLFQLASKSERTIVGLMSGTSLDGLDIVLCKIIGSGRNTKIELLQFETISYEENFRQEIKTIFSRRDVDLEKICLLNSYVALQHAAMVNECLKKWNCNKNEIDLIASHGQTIYHAPKFMHQQEKFSNATFQIGDGDHIAFKTGIITISDFRQKHIASGGEGAPLAAYGDYLLFSKLGEDRIMLNIGGISNFTFLPGNGDAKKIISTDVGPGNTLMNAFVQQYFTGIDFDKDATIAKQGKINAELLIALKQNSFFEKTFPKTIGPELFNLNYLKEAQQKSETISISKEDVMATLNRFTADCIADAINQINSSNSNFTIYISGGGVHNSLLIENIKSQLPNCNIKSTNDLFVNADAKEAVLFALLANECVCGNGIEIGEGLTQIPNVSFGKISFPN